MIPSRRGLLGGAGLLGLAAAGPTAAMAAAARAGAADLQATLERYFAFGSKASGGRGDEACGAWLEGELTRAGYACRRQAFEIPFFEARQATLACGEVRASVIPQAVVAPTGPQGLSAPLRLASLPGDLTGSIALVVLPYKRWIALADPEASRPLAQAIARGAAGAVLVTTGPTGEAIALNVSPRQPPLQKPVAVLAPKDAAPFLAAAAEGRAASLTLDGRGGRRSAFNLIAHLDRKAAKTVVVSTPRSGWFGCAAERGSGLAVWLWLARRLAQKTAGAPPDANLEFLATSGHEYQYFGGEEYLAHAAPPPAATRLWVHIGASAAARDWHELGPRLLPLPSADAQRVLTATADLLPSTRQAFQGIPGLEATYLADKAMAGGELTNVMNAGYGTAIGLYGVHRYFHTAADDLHCVSGELVWPVAAAFEAAIAAALKPTPR
ncbi:M28 family peptidase [Phenylobacterium sp.]|uniref:M28 family peptidase n=1 Tax=Phenylobacterium sp. TaxID=1871053 RepID=UPI00120DD38B|nr:M28 family peptidase [Phenylobacterium sp.]THD61257.1 MAG: M28 family peptidase [Phenylobacterium sp.]